MSVKWCYSLDLLENKPSANLQNYVQNAKYIGLFMPINKNPRHQFMMSEIC